ncbi:hypothetical protein [Lacisediminihabitans profunda]|uniref:Fe-S oxidoreductase n=1 Tax=Lacisediminihabitans profunda TaxID=2594790 RepID=A0A5C8UUX9_9MICO|nr:hypothetical protein [Lacisediminihabitans profunda]TXN31408.1 hypothetical protein FVP33_07615 [Lacisediminihabitans profunda]
MQLGTRWAVGTDAPPRLPEPVVAAIRSVEADLAGIDTSGWRWTLTWLEGRPVAELDDGTIVRVTADGTVVVTDPSEDGTDAS